MKVTSARKRLPQRPQVHVLDRIRAPTSESRNGNLRTDVSTAVTRLEFSHHLRVRSSANRLQICPHFLKEAFGPAGNPHDHDTQQVLRPIGKGVRDAPRAPRETAGRNLLQLVADL